MERKSFFLHHVSRKVHYCKPEYGDLEAYSSFSHHRCRFTYWIWNLKGMLQTQIYFLSEGSLKGICMCSDIKTINCNVDTGRKLMMGKGQNHTSKTQMFGVTHENDHSHCHMGLKQGMKGWMEDTSSWLTVLPKFRPKIFSLMCSIQYSWKKVRIFNKILLETRKKKNMNTVMIVASDIFTFKCVST